MAETFLTREELKELTGRCQKSLQIEQLIKMNVAFRINAAGRPVVTREEIAGKKRSHVKDEKWESRANP